MLANIGTKSKKKKNMFPVARMHCILPDCKINIKKDRPQPMALFLCVFLPEHSVNRQIAHCCFSIEKMKNTKKKKKKTLSCKPVFGHWKHTFFGLAL